jgi:hypothetical protein
MKLAALGVVTAGIGIALSLPGLVGIGVFWVLIGLVARAYKERLRQATPDPVGNAGAPASGIKPKPTVDGRTFMLGTLLWLAIGVPSLAVGLFELGIDAEHAEWRWLPIAVGGIALGIGVLGAILYGAGTVALAAADGAGTADKPATIWIRKVTETGTFVNERPRLAFELRVEPDAGTGLASYDVTKKATVPFTAMGSLRVGDGFRAVVVGPDKPTSMDIDWASPVPAATTRDETREPTSDSGSSDVAGRLEELDRLHQEAKITDSEYQAQRDRILGSL